MLRLMDGILAQVGWSGSGGKGGKREWSARSGMRLSVDGGDEREEGRRRGADGARVSTGLGWACLEGAWRLASCITLSRQHYSLAEHNSYTVSS